MCLLRVLSVINNYNQNGLILEASYCFTVLCLIAFISTALVSQWLSETFLGFTLTQGKQNQTIFVRLGGDFEQVRQENENFNSTAKEHMLFFSCVGSWNFTATLNKLLQQFLKNVINVCWPLEVLNIVTFVENASKRLLGISSPCLHL